MKQEFKKILCISVALVLCLMSLPFCAAADENLTVNGEKVSKGDTVTYEYYVGGIDDLVAAAGCYIEYDPTFLEYVDNSIGFDIFNNAMYTMDDGIIYYSAVNSINGYDMTSEKLVVAVSFKVLDTAKGSTNITHTFDEFFTIEDDSTDLTADDYEDSDALKVNSYDGTNNSPYLGTDADEMQNHLATTSYTVDDLLEGNPNTDVPVSASSNSSTSGTASSNSSTDESSASSASSEVASSSSSAENTPAESVSSEAVASTVDSKTESSSDETSEEKSGNAIVIVIGIAFAVVLVGAAFYFYKSKNK